MAKLLLRFNGQLCKTVLQVKWQLFEAKIKIGRISSQCKYSQAKAYDVNNFVYQTLTSACRVSALNNEIFDNPVELGLVVVILQTKLHKISASLRCLSGEELNLDFTDACLKAHFAKSRGLVDVDLTHFDKLLKQKIRFSAKFISRL